MLACLLAVEHVCMKWVPAILMWPIIEKRKMAKIINDFNIRGGYLIILIYILKW